MTHILLRSLRTLMALPFGWACGLLFLAGCMHASTPPQAQAANHTPRTLDLRPTLSQEQQLLTRPSGLEAVGPGPWSSNPYRGRPAVLEAGKQVFHAACAQCHGVEAEPTPEAPDLRRLNGFCRRLQDTELQGHCQSDVDQYFWSSVQGGKVRAGVVYMPSWKGVLSAEALWSVRTYLESLKPPPPVLLPEGPGGSPQ